MNPVQVVLRRPEPTENQAVQSLVQSVVDELTAPCGRRRR